MTTETVGGTSVSSGSRGEDGRHELAGAVHFHVASPAQLYQSCRELKSSRLFYFGIEASMDTTIVPVNIFRPPAAYQISIGKGLLRDAGVWFGRTAGKAPGKALIVSNRKVYGLYGDTLRSSLADAGYDVSAHLIGDGEKYKSLRTAEATLAKLSADRFTRADTVVALGGGVVGDVAGFAASVYLRGIAFLQIPTTLLSMIDSSVGGKTGVNSSFGKNLVGSFYQPRGVLVDIETLLTLPRRELTCGFCEAIKQGAVSGKALFRQTVDLLENYPPGRFRSHFADDIFPAWLTELLASQIGFKARIVQNDETESIKDNSARSRKILNFGHTFAHALEKASNYKGIKHGEAVGYGMIFAATLSKKLELIGQDEVDSLNGVVHRAGILPAISNIDPSKVVEAFRHDKKQVGNSLHWILLRGIGKPVIVPDADIPRSAIHSTLRAIIQD
jgi:3-dehydroquinate synthase